MNPVRPMKRLGSRDPRTPKHSPNIPPKEHRTCGSGRSQRTRCKIMQVDDATNLEVGTKSTQVAPHGSKKTTMMAVSLCGSSLCISCIRRTHGLLLVLIDFIVGFLHCLSRCASLLSPQCFICPHFRLFRDLSKTCRVMYSTGPLQKSAPCLDSRLSTQNYDPRKGADEVS